MQTGHALIFLMSTSIFPATVATAIDATQGSQPVHFETSCSPGIRDRFDYGVTMLHSFEYPESSRVFGDLIRTEPGCAMAYWGAAMSLWHPLWAPPAATDLRRGAELLAAADRLEATPRERAYLDALRAFFSDTDPDTHAVRVQRYAAAMSMVYHTYLETDPESAVFYALALLAAADPGTRLTATNSGPQDCSIG